MRQELLGVFLEHGDNSRLANAQSGRDELAGQGALARASRASDQHGIPGWDTAAQHFVQSRYTGRQTFSRLLKKSQFGVLRLFR